MILEIPSPPIDSFGPIRIYSLTMGLAMLAGVYISYIRYRKKYGDPKVIMDMFFITLIAGIIGARVYHLFTGYDWKSEGFKNVFNFRMGGLSIWGAVLAGALALFIQCKIKKISFLQVGDVVVPGLLVAQAIGRLGNYFNQELFGRELHSFWALKVDLDYRPFGLENVPTFHPTFLYEMVLNLFLAIVIIIAEKKYVNIRKGFSVALYISGYCFVRIFMELLRVDKATKIFNIRFNLLVSIILCLLGLTWMMYLIFSSKVKRVGPPK
ncbi:MAG: prolipoprotein diacylglyceryl transferase [Acidimicrobiia bacterium]